MARDNRYGRRELLDERRTALSEVDSAFDTLATYSSLVHVQPPVIRTHPWFADHGYPRMTADKHG